MSDLQRVGPVFGGTGTAPPFTADISGAQRVTDAHGRYFDAVRQGNIFIGADLGGTPVTTQAGLSATTPALTLYNPVNSGKLGVLYEVTLGLNAAPAAACFFMLAVNAPTAAAPTATTAATVQNALTSSLVQPSLQCFRVATLAAAPLAIRFWTGVTGAAALTPNLATDKIDGAIIIGPGVALSIQTSSAAAIAASLTWEEIPFLI